MIKNPSKHYLQSTRKEYNIQEKEHILIKRLKEFLRKTHLIVP